MSGPTHSERRITVLVIDDEPQIRRVVRNAVENADTRVIEAPNGSSGVDMAAAEQPALIILDLGLPDREGVDVCRDLRAFTSKPIIVLSARHQEREKVALLDAGADDYITKPFSTAELQARVRAQLRRAQSLSGPRPDAELEVGGLVINFVKRSVHVDDALIHLTPTEWGLLRALATHPDQTLTHSQLFQAVWGSAAGDAQQYLRVYVGQLRRKIEADPVRPRYIKTEPAVGYRFETGS
ncbi:MAG: response regulator transcription factor [Phycisphaerae bacterium]|nr:response regulator transcription factor [Gemmatimonadaceae bacterium]